jgi:hypothetical protein
MSLFPCVYLTITSVPPTLETADLQGMTRRTEAPSDDHCVADDRTVQYLIHNPIRHVSLIHVPHPQKATSSLQQNTTNQKEKTSGKEMTESCEEAE